MYALLSLVVIFSLLHERKNPHNVKITRKYTRLRDLIYNRRENIFINLIRKSIAAAVGSRGS